MQDPKCPFFHKPNPDVDPKKDFPDSSKCGGCATQHIEYELQLENKKKKLSDITGFNDIQVFSDDPWNYRNRMDMVFTRDGLGFREKGRWWKTVAVGECVISNSRLNELKREVEDFFGPEFDFFHVKERVGTLKYAVIRTPQNDSCISIVLNKESENLDKVVAEVKKFAEKTTANNVLITYIKAKSSQSIGEDYEIVKGTDMVHETICAKVLHYSPQGFFQNNSVMAEKMHEYTRQLLSDRRPNGGPDGEKLYAHLLDLYGGVGAFGIVNADLFHKVTSVEDFEACTVAAKENMKRNDIENMEAICMDAKRLKQVNLPEKNLYVITDPPRVGMHEETIIQLRKLKPKLIIYISCNVDQLAKDLPKFKDYKIKSAAVFDLFPQTNHMESVIELVPKIG